MPMATANGIEIAYESHGDPAAPTIVLIMGLAAQLEMWPADFIDSLVKAGYHVIRFDNRDIGLTTKFEGARTPNLVLQILLRRIGIKLKTPYDLSDMAADTAGLMDALGIDDAHIIGVSMGGMIGQFLAATYPDRINSLTAIMTTTGNPKLPRPSREIMRAMMRRPEPPTTREEIIARSVAAFDVIGTPGEDHNTNGMRDRIIASVDRDYTPSGPVRQTAAILASGDFRNMTRRIGTPTLVIHGSADPLVSPEAGKDIAAIVPGAQFELIEGMGHDIPPTYLPQITQLILDHLRRT